MCPQHRTNPAKNKKKQKKITSFQNKSVLAATKNIFGSREKKVEINFTSDKRCSIRWSLSYSKI